MNLKKEAGGGMTVLGSGTIVRRLANFGLIDEYRLLVNPIILGPGRVPVPECEDDEPEPSSSHGHSGAERSS